MPSSRFTESDFDRMAALREGGKTCQQIASMFGCARGTISWHCLRLGADGPRHRGSSEPREGPLVVRRGDHVVRRFTSDEDERLIELEATGENLSAIARALGRQRNSVLGRLMTLARRDDRRERAHG